MAVAACSGRDKAIRPEDEPLEGFIGGVVADEPQAALIGRDVLAIGGNAVDAAVATAFAMAVTLPSQASLGGGGLCLVFERKSGEVRALDFTARAPAVVPPTADRPTAVPGHVRGFYTLHARYGKLPWSQAVAPAERLARFGALVSRALAQDIVPVRSALEREPDVRRVLAAPGRPGLVDDGDRIEQPELAAMLARLRTEGPAGLYAGQGAEQFANAVRSAGGSLDRLDLASYRPQWLETLRLRLGDEVAHFAPPPFASGHVAGAMLAMLADGGRYRRASTEERPHLLIEVAARAFADRPSPATAPATGRGAAETSLDRLNIDALMAGYASERRDTALFTRLPAWPAENPAAASVIAIDRNGNAVSCAVTTNSLFGSGRIAPGTGIFLASMPGPGGRGASALTPMLIANPNVREFHFAATGIGGTAAPVALAQTAARALLAGEPLAAAIGNARVLGGSDGERVYAEPSLAAGPAEGLRRRGHALAVTPQIGRVNGIACLGGLPPEPRTCAAAADPRGFGLAVLGQ
jgi:gamma-glutamyltranspeptidase/glutathione hydrolase